MLVLGRKKGESIIIGNEVEIQIIDIQHDQVKIGIAAPKNISIQRKEIYEEIIKQNQQAISTKHNAEKLLKNFKKI